MVKLTEPYNIKQHYVDIIDIDPKIRLVTICDSNDNIMHSRHREGVKNLLSEEESKKSRACYECMEEKIKHITMPLGDNHLLYVTTEVESDHSALINRIQNLNLK